MFEDNRGRKQATLIDDPLTRKGVGLWLDRVLAFYGDPGGGVDIEIIDDQIIMNEKTVEYVYSAYTPLDIRYVPGSRPMLEQVVASCLRPEMSEREKSLALMRRVRDNQDCGLARPDLFYGGTEEELLKRGALMCNEVSRLFVCLCQIAGLPARVFCSHISGHMMTEVYCSGRWCWIDPMIGVAPVKDNDEPASAWELHLDRRLFERQPQRVWDDIRAYGKFLSEDVRDVRHRSFLLASYRDCHFHPREANAVGNYFVWESGRYTYAWRIVMADPEKLHRARNAEQVNRIALGWPAHYLSCYAFDETLSPR